jgi:hypothetical protein
MTSSLFWDITQSRLVVSYQSCGTTYRSHLQGSKQSKKTNYQSTLRNIAEDRRSQPVIFQIPMLVFQCVGWSTSSCKFLLRWILVLHSTSDLDADPLLTTRNAYRACTQLQYVIFIKCLAFGQRAWSDVTIFRKACESGSVTCIQRRGSSNIRRRSCIRSRYSQVTSGRTVKSGDTHKEVQFVKWQGLHGSNSLVTCLSPPSITRARAMPWWQKPPPWPSIGIHDCQKWKQKKLDPNRSYLSFHLNILRQVTPWHQWVFFSPGESRSQTRLGPSPHHQTA